MRGFSSVCFRAWLALTAESKTSEAEATCTVERQDGAVAYVFTGHLVTGLLASLERELASPKAGPGEHAVIRCAGVVECDTGGAWLIRRTRDALLEQGADVQIEGLEPRFVELLALVDTRLAPLKRIPRPEATNVLERVGRSTWAFILDLMALLAFIGEATVAQLRQFRDPRRMRIRMTAKIVQDAGLDAMPIVGLLVFLLGIVVAYQGGRQLVQYGANIFVVELVALIMLRELAPLIAAIIVAGRTGSAYAAEIGTMRVTEEIDALETIGIGPFDQLVLPKVVGLMIALPLLVVFADVLGILGGMFIASSVLGVTFTDFLQRMPQAISTSDFVVGVAKAPVFALIIAMVGCHQGFQVKGGADSVGKQTTVSVVQSIFLVIVSDAIFSVLFSWLGV